MDERERRELQSLCDLFRQSMTREIDQPVFDQEARERIGNIIGSAVRHGWSQFAYDSQQ